MQTSILWTLYFWGSDLLKPSTTILNEAVSIRCDIWKIKSSPYSLKRIGQYFKRLKTFFFYIYIFKIIVLTLNHGIWIDYHWILRFSEVFKQILMSNPMAPQFNNWSKNCTLCKCIQETHNYNVCGICLRL